MRHARRAVAVIRSATVKCGSPEKRTARDRGELPHSPVASLPVIVFFEADPFRHSLGTRGCFGHCLANSPLGFRPKAVLIDILVMC